MTNDLHAVPILFPEWPRFGIDESQRIYALHFSIAQKQPACVAPIPQAFDLAKVRTPDIGLHSPDGNHSSPAGAFLASLVIANTITLLPPDRLPTFPRFPSTPPRRSACARWPPNRSARMRRASPARPRHSYRRS
jgi:hypothetical protein